MKTPDDGTVNLPEACRVLYQIKLRNSASYWFLLYEYITLHGPRNVKLECQMVMVMIMMIIIMKMMIMMIRAIMTGTHKSFLM